MTDKKEKIILGTINIQPLINMKIIMVNSFEKFESEERTELEEMGIIKTFEVSYELAWKTLKKILEIQGVEALSPREVFRSSSQFGYLEDPQIWFDFGKERNMTAHVYDGDTFQNILNFIPKFLKEFRKLINNLEQIK
jgi:nucleotidyltransferase substrate binding protein (TIGR01987 family)